MNNRIHIVVACLLAAVGLVLTGSSMANSAAAQTQAVTASPQGVAWNIVSSPVTDTLNSVAMVSANDGWAVGDGGTILRWNGNAWAKVPSPLTTDIKSVTMVSANDGWAVAGATVLRWNGSSWTQVAISPARGYSDVSATSANSVWVIGGTVVCSPNCTSSISWTQRWNGSTWIDNGFIHQIYTEAFEMMSDSDGWAVGFTTPESFAGAIVHWNGSGWANATFPAAGRLFDVAASSPTNAWAVGLTTDYLGATLKWDGSTWTLVSNPANDALYSVAIISAADAWATGGTGTIIHWDGSTWATVSSPVTTTLNSVAMLSSNEGWAVGSNGTILHYALLASLTINHAGGKPGSFFTLTGTDFPPNSIASVIVNDHTLTTTIAVDASGGFVFLLNTSLADAGFYNVTAVVNPSASTSLVLDPNAPLYPQEGSGPIISVPAGIAWKALYLPLVQR